MVSVPQTTNLYTTNLGTRYLVMSSEQISCLALAVAIVTTVDVNEESKRNFGSVLGCSFKPFCRGNIMRHEDRMYICPIFT